MPNGCFCLAPPGAGGRDASLRVSGGEEGCPWCPGWAWPKGPSAPASCSRGSGQSAAPALGPGSGCYLSSPSSLSGKRLGVGGLPCLVASKLLSSSISDNSRLHSDRGSCADRPQNQTDSHRSARKRKRQNQNLLPRGKGCWLRSDLWVTALKPSSKGIAKKGKRGKSCFVTHLGCFLSPPLLWGFAG